jgi:iron complex transport system substrate-binding protein
LEEPRQSVQSLKGILSMVHRISILLAPLMLLAACGGAPATPAPAPISAPAAPAPTSAPAASAAYSVTIEHKYGSTAILQAPTRIVSVGFNDQDAIMALGVVRVGIRDWYGVRRPI